MMATRISLLACLSMVFLVPLNAEAQISFLCERIPASWMDDNQYTHTYPVGGWLNGVSSWDNTTLGDDIFQDGSVALGTGTGTNMWTMDVTLIADAITAVSSTTAAPQVTAESANLFSWNMTTFGNFSMFQEAISTAVFEILPSDEDPNAEECLLTAEFNLSINPEPFPAGVSSINMACADGNQNTDLDNWAWVSASRNGNGGTTVQAFLPQADGPTISYTTNIPPGVYSVTLTASKIVPVGHVFTLYSHPRIAGGPIGFTGGPGSVFPYATGTASVTVSSAP